MSSLADQLNKRTTRPEPWEQLLASLDDADRQTLEAAMRNRSMSTAKIRRGLHAIGRPVGKALLYEMRPRYRKRRR